jgi:hypothetical protein
MCVFKWCANAAANLVFPQAVGPKITIKLYIIQNG